MLMFMISARMRTGWRQPWRWPSLGFACTKTTRLIEFGRFAATNRRRRGEGRPETFDFLGFTHYCGKTLDGRFMVHRKTQRGRMVRKLKELRQELKRRMHTRLREQHGWLARVLRGHYAYYGVAGDSYGLRRFLTQLQSLAYGDPAARTKAADVVGPFQRSFARQSTATAQARSRLARSSGLIRGYSSEEPDAGKAASPDLWGRRRATATSTRPLPTLG